MRLSRKFGNVCKNILRYCFFFSLTRISQYLKSGVRSGFQSEKRSQIGAFGDGPGGEKGFFDMLVEAGSGTENDDVAESWGRSLFFGFWQGRLL